MILHLNIRNIEFLFRRSVNSRQQLPHDASEVMGNALPHQVANELVSSLPFSFPVGNNTAPQAPQIFFTVATNTGPRFSIMARTRPWKETFMTLRLFYVRGGRNLAVEECLISNLSNLAIRPAAAWLFMAYRYLL